MVMMCALLLWRRKQRRLIGEKREADVNGRSMRRPQCTEDLVLRVAHCRAKTAARVHASAVATGVEAGRAELCVEGEPLLHEFRLRAHTVVNT